MIVRNEVKYCTALMAHLIFVFEQDDNDILACTVIFSKYSAKLCVIVSLCKLVSDGVISVFACVRARRSRGDTRARLCVYARPPAAGACAGLKRFAYHSLLLSQCVLAIGNKVNDVLNKICGTFHKRS